MRHLALGWHCEAQSVPRKYLLYLHICQSSLNCWYKAEWRYSYMIFMPNLDLTIEMQQQNWRFIRSDNSLQFSVYLILVSSHELYPQFWADRSGTQCNLLLLQPVCFEVPWLLYSCVTIWVTVVFLSHGSSLASGLWPLASTIHFCTENFCSWNSFSFLDISV